MLGSRVTNPWAKPAGTRICFQFSAVMMAVMCLPKVGELRRMSTATSRIPPRITRTSFVLGHGRQLVVQAADDAFFGGKRMIVLHEIAAEASLFQQAGVENLGKEAAVVAVLVGEEDFKRRGFRSR